MSLRRYIVMFATLVVMGALVGCTAEEPPATAIPAPDDLSIIDSLQLKLEWVDYRLAQERWTEATEGRSDSLEFFADLYRDIISDQRAYEGLRGRRSRVNDDLELRRYDLVYPVLVRAQVDHDPTVHSLCDSLERYLGSRWCRVEGQRKSPVEAHADMTRSRGRTARELAYRALGDPGEAAIGQMGRVFRLRNQAARRLGYNDYFSLCANVDRFESTAYRELLEQVDDLTRPAYEGLATELKSGFGSEDFDQWDWDHRFANTISEVDRFLPVDSQQAFLKRTLDGLGFKLNQLPIYMRFVSAAARAPRPGVHIVNAPHDIRMIGHVADGFDNFCGLMRQAGTALHAAEISQDAYILARSDDPARTASVAAFFEQLCAEPEWLERYPGLSSGQITRFTRARDGIELLRLRLLLVDATFEYEAYHNPNQNLNTLYWRLFEEYTGLPKHDDLAPWAGKVEFISQPLAAYHRLLGQAAARQNLDYLKSEYGSVVDNPEVGSFLTHSYFRFGSRYDWRELIERATGEKLTPEYMAGR